MYWIPNLVSLSNLSESISFFKAITRKVLGIYMVKAVYMMAEPLFEAVYSKETQAKIAAQVEVIAPVITRDHVASNHLPEKLDQVRLIFAGWGAPQFDKELLDKMPNLKVIFYAAGTMKSLLTEEVWARDIRITTANTANAIPVADFTLAEILFSLKNGWQMVNKLKEDKTFVNGIFQPVTGIYQATVGIISLSQVGKMVIDRLKPFDLNILAYDPYASQADADKLGVTLVDLDTLFKQSNVVSLHTPLLPETTGMITGTLIASLPENATFINTARGAIVNEMDMIQVLNKRPDLMALLDVTDPEPAPADSPLYTIKNVVLTPHIAGSVGRERSRLGDVMFAESQRYLNGDDLVYEITEEAYRHMA